MISLLINFRYYFVHLQRMKNKITKKKFTKILFVYFFTSFVEINRYEYIRDCGIATPTNTHLYKFNCNRPNALLSIYYTFISRKQFKVNDMRNFPSKQIIESIVNGHIRVYVYCLCVCLCGHKIKAIKRRPMYQLDLIKVI